MNKNNETQNTNTTLQEQLEAAYPRQAEATNTASSLEGLDPQSALEAFSLNPVGFIQAVVHRAANEHLYNLKEEAELRGALLAFRKVHPESRQFEPFILQEVAELIKNDQDGDIDPWDKLLEKGLENFKSKFKEALKQDPDMLEKQAAAQTAQPALQMETGDNRRPVQAAPSFTREQIGKMSLSDFIAQEEAINDALRNKRIR